MWRLDPSPILCFDGDSAGQKAAIRAALRALPLLGPERTLRFVELPAGQDPDDVVRARRPRGVRGAARQARAARRAAVAPRGRGRAADHARSPRRPPPAPDRPCQRDRPTPTLAPHLPRRLAQPLRRPASPRSAVQPGRGAAAAPRARFKNGRCAPPEPPAGDTCAAIGRQRDRRADGARAASSVSPISPRNCRPIASSSRASRSPTASTAKLRDELVNAAFSGAALDREALATILGTRWSGGRESPSRAMGFSFTRRDSDPDRARRDLAAAVEIIAATEEVEQGPGSTQPNG